MTSGYLSEDIESIYSGYSQLSSSSWQQIVECFSIFILPINGYGIQFNFDRYHITTYMNYRVLHLTNLKLFQEIFHLLINVTPHPRPVRPNNVHLNTDRQLCTTTTVTYNYNNLNLFLQHAILTSILSWSEFFSISWFARPYFLSES